MMVVPRQLKTKVFNNELNTLTNNNRAMKFIKTFLENVEKYGERLLN